jgi:ribose transport system ATP-binding protein
MLPLLDAKGIEKSYGATRALAGVDLDIGQGEVLALVGENGAGKSTLGKILAGVTHADAGVILLEGREVSFRSTSEALAAGVAIVLQELNLIPVMSVAENILFTRPEGYRWGWWRSRKSQLTLARTAIDTLAMDFGINPETLVSELSVAQQQIVEIVRALSVDAKLFILDEPTAALGRREVIALLALIRRMKADGRSVIMVTHRLEEVFAVADRIIVLRDGVGRGEFDPTTTSTEDLISAMVGRQLGLEMEHARTIREPGETILSVTDLVVEPHGPACSLAVRRGEILGIAGLVGSGRTELVRAIFGADRASSGNVTINGGHQLARSPLSTVKAGGAYVPEDRKTQGLHTGLSIHDNIVLSELAKHGSFWPNLSKLRRQVAEKIQDLNIKVGGAWQDAGVLSGGNQQKVVLAKCLLSNPDLLILDEPTRGIDVGARTEFYKIIDALVHGGMAILLVSSELTEVLALSDRILVMSRGAIVEELSRDEATEEKILAKTEVGATNAA